MVKITSKLYRPSDLLEVIKMVEDCLINKPSTASDLVLAIRKKGFKIVKVDNGK